MENEQLKQTKFDSMVTNKNMQLAKAVIPYIDNRIGNYLGMYIKFKELQNAARINSNVAVAAMNADKHKENIGMESMFEDIKDFLSDDERETIDTIMTMMEMMNMDDDAKQDFMGSYMNMFGM
ncbi:MAG: hypothetical protein ACLRZ9_07165 [Eubacterium sp.]